MMWRHLGVLDISTPYFRDTRRCRHSKILSQVLEAVAIEVIEFNAIS
jgi:hypothetical protein